MDTCGCKNNWLKQIKKHILLKKRCLTIIKLLKYLYIKIKSKLNKNTIVAIDIADKHILTFKNGSIVECLPTNDSTTIRGKRSELPIYYDNFE